MKKRVIAMHLPQFYPFKENDEWWGKGFTEWRNVANARPRFRGHYQPHIPSDLGFYDLRLKECRLEQQKLAREYGIDGFCYYHYWFNGHLIMEKPVEGHLADKEETLPFMFCWANEDWHRNWAGDFNETLISHTYSKEDDVAHFNYLLPFFKDERYIKVDGRPVFAIYRADFVPDIDAMISTFQECAAKEGFSIYFIKVEGRDKSPLPASMDAMMEFAPFNTSRNFEKFWHHPFESFCRRVLHVNYGKQLYSYKKYIKDIAAKPKADVKTFPSVFPSWDNASRRVGQQFLAFKGSTPKLFENLFETVYDSFTPYSEEENFVFINAWNEWAEGNHLEPDLKWGRGYLEAISKVVNKSQQ